MSAAAEAAALAQPSAGQPAWRGARRSRPCPGQQCAKQRTMPLTGPHRQVLVAVRPVLVEGGIHLVLRCSALLVGHALAPAREEHLRAPSLQPCYTRAGVSTPECGNRLTCATAAAANESWKALADQVTLVLPYCCQRALVRASSLSLLMLLVGSLLVVPCRCQQALAVQSPSLRCKWR